MLTTDLSREGRLKALREGPYGRCVYPVSYTHLFQTVFTFPHFISWVVLSGILINMFASNGIINQLLGQMGFEQIAPLMRCV